jgi:hypothetical protein
MRQMRARRGMLIDIDGVSLYEYMELRVLDTLN